jgi:hypothetical protein
MLAVIFTLFFGCPAEAMTWQLRLGTGPSGTFSHFAGQQLCRIINASQEEIHCSPVETPDELHNLTNLRSGFLDIGLVDSRTVHQALHQTGEFQYLDISYQALRLVLPLNDVPVALVVRQDSGITKLDELTDKRINAGMPGSREHRTMELIMEAKGWSKTGFRLFEGLSSTQSQDTMALCHGSIQAMLHIGVHPDRKLDHLFSICQATLAPMQDRDITALVNTHPGYSLTTIPAGSYESIPGPIGTFGTTTLLMTSRDLGQDLVFSLLQVLARNLDDLAKAHPALDGLSAKPQEPMDPKLQLHPGAAAYFQAVEKE